MIVDEEDYLEHHGILGQKWGVRNGPPYPLSSSASISKESYAKINDIYKRMPSLDRRLIDPDSKDGDDYYDSYDSYKKNTAYNGIKDDGFLIAEKIPDYANVDDTKGVEIGIGVLSKGKGTGTKLTKDLIDWFNGQDEYDTIWWPVDKNNKASINLALKSGFIKDPYGSNYMYATDESFEKQGIERSLKHHGIPGQKWGVLNGPPYPLGSGGKPISNGNAVFLKDYDGPAYFISEKKLDGKTIHPRVPKNYFTKHGFEDDDTPRISFAPTIDQCLAGLSQNVEGKTYYVYKPEDISKCYVYKPNNKAVPDSTITGELWVTNPTKLKLDKKIKVTGDRGSDGKEFSYGDKKAVLFDDWIYEETD